MHDHADGEAEELVDLAHPFGVALGQVVVHRDDVDALAFERVEIDRQGGDQRLAFAGLHLGDLALVQDHAAHELDVEMALAERALGRLAHRGEGLDQQVVEGLALGQALAELGGLGAQLLVARASSNSGSSALIFATGLSKPLTIAIVGCAEQASGERPQHENLDIVTT